MTELMRLKATNGTIIAYEDKVVISRKGLVAFSTQGGFKGDKTIYYKDLSSVEFKKPGWTNGYMQFVIPGSLNSSAKVGIMGSSLQSAKDGNTVILRAFNKKTPKESEQLYELLLSKIEEHKSSTNIEPGALSEADELRKYKKLLDEGIITQIEFDNKKKQLLS